MRNKSISLKDHWFFGPVIESKRKYLNVLFSSVFINIFALASAFFIMIVYDKVIPNNSTETLIALTVGIAFVIWFDFIMKVLRGIFTDKAGEVIDGKISNKLYNKIARNESLGNKPVGAISSIIKDLDLLKDFLGSASFVAFVDFPFIILFLFVLYSIGGPIAIVPGLIVLFVIIAGLIVQPIIRNLTTRASEDGQAKQSVLVEMLSGINTLKVLKGIDLFRERWEGSVERQGKLTTRTKFWSQLTSNLAQTGQQISQVGIVFYGVFLISEGSLTMGSLIACVILSGRTLAPLGQITGLLGKTNHAITAYKNFDEIMRNDGKEEGRRKQLRKEELEGSIELKNVNLSYEGRDDNALSEISFDIKAGEKVAIIGKVGSGKTTIMNLISGLLDPTSGSIEIGGVNIKHLHPDDLRKTIGVVSQTPYLFSGTLKENLLMGEPEATDKQIELACNISGVNEIAKGLPEGFETVLSEGGSQLSGGQRQQISIARAFMSDAKIIVMDEPSSSMDSTTENNFLKNLKVVGKEKTLIIITHRNTLLDAVDRVVVVDSGTIVLDGEKKEVLKKLSGGKNEKQ